MSSMVRLGEAKDVDLLINRLSLSRMSVPAIDALIEQYLRSIRQNQRDIKSGDPLFRSNFGIVIGTVVPEILSRLAVKSSSEKRNAILHFTLDLYRSESRSHYRGVRNLVKRLIRSYSDDDTVGLIHQLIEFPVLQSRNPLVEREFINPFEVVFEKNLVEIRDSVESTDTASVGRDQVDRIVADALSEHTARRSWAILTLTVLNQVGLLTANDAIRYTDALWARTDEFGLPKDTGFESHAVYLWLPAPSAGAAADAFRSYVERTPFPIQGGKGPVKMTGDVPLCLDIRDASRDFEWTDEDVGNLIDRAAEWWDADKARLRSRSEPGPFGSVKGIFTERLQQLVDALAAVLIHNVSLNGEDGRRDTLMRLSTEFRDHGLHTVRVEACCLHIFPDRRGKVLRDISTNLGSEIEMCVVDGLNALLTVAGREERSSESDSAFNTVGQAIRWRRDTIVRHYLDVVADVVDRYPDLISVIGEELVLLGLKDLIRFTEPGGEGLGYPDRLSIRKSAARLAYRLNLHFSQVGRRIPDAIDAWARICASNNEFAEISNQWKKR